MGVLPTKDPLAQWLGTIDTNCGLGKEATEIRFFPKMFKLTKRFDKTPAKKVQTPNFPQHTHLIHMQLSGLKSNSHSRHKQLAQISNTNKNSENLNPFFETP